MTTTKKQPPPDEDDDPGPLTADEKNGKGKSEALRHERRRDDEITPRSEPTPGWSNGNTTPIVFAQSPPVDMSIPGWSNNGPASTGATAGAPGAWTPALSDPPNKFTSMNTIVASPATAWTTGQYVVLGDGSFAHWGGTAWTSGKA